MGEGVYNEVDELCCACEWRCSQDGQVVVSDDDDGQGRGSVGGGGLQLGGSQVCEVVEVQSAPSLS